MTSRFKCRPGLVALLFLALAAPQATLAAGGGPDPFGYRWLDNNPVTGGCAYNFVDIGTSGTSIGTGDDTVYSGIPIGFNFTYYGVVYTQVNVSTNGYLVFGTTGNSFGNTCPQPVTLNDLQVSPFWDDGYVFSPSSMRYQTVGTAPDRTFIVQWTNVSFCCSAPPPGMTYQVQLRETSNIIAFMYSDVQQSARTQGDSATIGIDGPGPTNFLGTSCNTSGTLTNGHARFFLPPGVAACVVAAVPTTTTVTSSWNPSLLGGTVFFTAQVNEIDPATPTGNVTFVIDGVPEATVPLDGSGAAVYSTASLAAGDHTVVADYAGDLLFEPSTSATLVQVVLLPEEIPTLSTLGLVALGLALAGAAFLVARRRRGRAA